MKNVFITGASGTIGCSLLPLYLREPETNIHILLRAKSKEHLQQRLEEVCSFSNIKKEFINTRIFAYSGDIRRPHLGFTEEQYKKLSPEITHIIHAAADVRINLGLDEALAMAVQGTDHILQFAQDCKQLQKLEYVSAVGVNGSSSVPLPEAAVTYHREFHNTYEFAKAKAEDLVVSKMQDLPISVHRPSMMVGDTKKGKIKNHMLFYRICDFMLGNNFWGLMPDFDGYKFDIIPIDYVCSAIYHSSNDKTAKGKFFNLCSGDENALFLTDLAEVVQEYAVENNLKHRELRYINPNHFSLLIKGLSLVATGKDKRRLAAVPLMLDYLKQQPLFVTENTRNYFNSFNLMLPSPQDYIEVVLDTYFSNSVKTTEIPRKYNKQNSI